MHHVRKVITGNTFALLAAFAVLFSNVVSPARPADQPIRRAGELQVRSLLPTHQFSQKK